MKPVGWTMAVVLLAGALSGPVAGPTSVTFTPAARSLSASATLSPRRHVASSDTSSPAPACAGASPARTDTGPP